MLEKSPEKLIFSGDFSLITHNKNANLKATCFTDETS